MANNAVKDKWNITQAQSFRLGEEHIEKLKRMAERSDLPQVEILRDLIDKAWDDMQAKRKLKLKV